MGHDGWKRFVEDDPYLTPAAAFVPGVVDSVVMPVVPSWSCLPVVAVVAAVAVQSSW